MTRTEECKRKGYVGPTWFCMSKNVVHLLSNAFISVALGNRCLEKMYNKVKIYSGKI